MLGSILSACNTVENTSKEDKFEFLVERFAEFRILKYQVPGFDELSLNQKKLIYYLSQAALCGRDIIYDQNGKYNLMVRHSLENIYQTYTGNKENEEYKAFVVYLKKVWFSNGIHHHYGMDKFVPGFTPAYMDGLIANSDKNGFPLMGGQNLDAFKELLHKVIFDKDYMAKRVNLDPSKDLVASSACNFYLGVDQHEAENFYASMKDTDDTTPISHGLNSRLVKENGILKEEVYKLGGLYGEAIEKIIFWIEKALPYAETEHQQQELNKLIAYYKTGDLETWDEYNVLWVTDTVPLVDYVNGFIEVYGDPLGMKATWESIVNFKNMEATRRTKLISENAQWFEDNSPVAPVFKKKKVKGVTGKVITVAQLAGDCYPATPIGINLPNANWIRKEHGSKSVTIENITYAYDQVMLESGFLDEFAYNEDEKELIKKYGSVTSNLHTDLHEILGHGSGQLLPGVSDDALKNYHSTLEETRADLFALYYIYDQKLVDLGVLPEVDAAK
ncbi:MAG: dihydrofolate reductase, partial [Bacteroidales bacterium]|nr:dihydrofolate reductase [Bacteroidales bacterium]